MPIAVDVANIGHYEWVVPHHISSHCLVRVSEVKERKMPPHGLVYEMDFRVNGADFSGSGDSFTIYLGDAANESIKNNIPWVSFSLESNGKVYIHLNDISKEIGRFTGFNDRWHNIRVFMDNVYDRISVILDGVLVFESIPRSPMAYFSPALSFAVGPGNTNEVEIDDVSVIAFYSQENSIQGKTSSYPGLYALGPRPPLKFTTLFNEDFQQLNGKNGIENTGWRTKGEQTLGSHQLEPGLKHLSIQPGEDEQVTVVKSFNIPLDFPFDTSDKTFEIRYNDDMFSESAAYDQIDGFPGHGGSAAAATNFYSSSSTTLSNNIPGRSRTADLINTYYIYTFDGKLLAEYDHNGNCTRDYIYFGNRLIAEYKPQTSEYFYYMTDQINSTRIITNDSGNVVFSEAAGPYGDVQKTWINTYDPKLKFSGKEREGYSDLDYFGARYYDHKSYRFNSVDPVINRVEALSNPQLWNLYAYCRNNPISFVDPTGALEHFTFLLNNQNTSYLEGSGMSITAFSGYGEHKNNPSSTNVVGLGPLPTGKYYIVDRPKGLKEKIFGAGKKENWFALFRADDKIDDETDVYVGTNKFEKRSQVRLHFGVWSAGCLTVENEKDYKKLRKKLLTTKTSKIPGTDIKHYGTIEVKKPQRKLKEN